MALSRIQINKNSDERRGVKVKSLKFHLDDIALIEQASKDLGIPQSKLVMDAIKFYLANK